MNKIVSYLVKIISQANQEYTDLQLKKIEYGLTCILNDITKFIMYFIIFYIFSVQKYFLITVMFFCTIRLFAGGYHSKNYWRCFVMSFIILTAIILIGRYVIVNNITLIFILIVSFICVCIYAPVDNINKRIKSKERRFKLKIVAIIITALLSIICFYIPSKYLMTSVTSVVAAVIMMIIGKINNN